MLEKQSCEGLKPSQGSYNPQFSFIRFCLASIVLIMYIDLLVLGGS